MSNYIQQKKIFNKKEQGFAMLFTVLLVSIALTISISISSVAYNQAILTSTAKQANRAFYAADAGIECALLFEYDPNSIEPFDCLGTTVDVIGLGDYSLEENPDNTPNINAINLPENNGCVIVTSTVTTNPNGSEGRIIESKGYNVPCDQINTNPRRVERAIRVRL